MASTLADNNGFSDSVILIGLTGGIGAGKSVVSRVLRTMGYPVYDCDSEAKRIMQTSSEVRDRLVEWFGEECYLSDGCLNRAHLASYLFAEDGENHRQRVNKLVHTMVREEVIQWSRENFSDARPVFVESAILSTSGLDGICRRVWLIEAGQDLRIQRALKRGGISEDDIRRRILTQQYEFDKLPKDKLSVIDNSGRKSLIMQIRELLTRLKQ